jgi:hypothetical protein
MAYKPPQVQTMSQAMKDLNPAYAAVTQNLNQQQALVPQKYDAQRAAINAERGQGFNAINNQATARGGSFSVVPVNEQSVYLATKYLPGLQQADFQQNAEQLEIAGRLADIEKEKRTTALNTINQQKSDLTSWNSARAAEQASAKERALDRAAQARESALDRAASAASRAPTGPSSAYIIDHLNKWASSRIGKVDKKLSPSDFKSGFQEAAKFGMDSETYVAVMQRYVNNSHAKDYIF